MRPLLCLALLAGSLACTTPVAGDAAAAPGALAQPPWAKLTCPTAPVDVGTEVAVQGEVAVGAEAELQFPPAEGVHAGTTASHPYTAPGTYTVVLTARSDVGENRARCLVVVVDPNAVDGPAPGEDDVPPPVQGDDDPPPVDDDGAPPPVQDDDDAPIVAPPVASPTSGVLAAQAKQLNWYWTWGIPTDGPGGALLGEVLLADLQGADPLATTTTLPLAGAGTAAGLRGVAGFEDAVALHTSDWGAPADILTGMVAIELRGTLTPPAGAVTFDLDVEGTDAVIVGLDGQVVASSDGAYAYDELRDERAPTSLVGRPVAGPLDLGVVAFVGNAAMTWDVRFTFRDAAGADLGGGTAN